MPDVVCIQKAKQLLPSCIQQQHLSHCLVPDGFQGGGILRRKPLQQACMLKAHASHCAQGMLLRQRQHGAKLHLFQPCRITGNVPEPTAEQIEQIPGGGNGLIHGLSSLQTAFFPAQPIPKPQHRQAQGIQSHPQPPIEPHGGGGHGDRPAVPFQGGEHA